MANNRQRRRGRGDGSVYQRGDGLWTAYARLENGQRRYVYSKTRVEVAQKLKKLQKEIDTRTVVTAGKGETVQAFLQHWLSVRKGRKDIKPGTVASYKNHLAPCMPYIGHVKLTKLTGDALQVMCNSLLEKRKPSTVHAMLTILSTAFSDAIRWQRLSFNPCKGVVLPQAEKHEGPVLTGEHALALLSAAKGHPLEGFLHVALATGLRKGELLALKWSDIDFETRLLKVSRNAVYLPDDETGHYKMSEGTPKSRAGKRTIRLPQFAVNALSAHKRRQLEQRLAAGSVWTDTGLIFCNHRGAYYSLSALDTQFKKLVAGAGLPAMRIHDLRHSAATLLLKMGVDMKVIQEILGHASYHITANVYSHVLMEMQDEAASRMDNLFLSAK